MARIFVGIPDGKSKEDRWLERVERIRARLEGRQIEHALPAPAKECTTTFYRCKQRRRERDEVFIYGLADPRDHVIRYVGKTTRSLRSRKRGHKRHPTNAKMEAWLASLPGVESVVLERCHRSKWDERERAWIAKLGGVTDLLNVMDGGRYGKPRKACTWVSEVREKSGPVKVLSREEIQRMSDSLSGQR